MKIDSSALPNDVDALQALVREQGALLEARDAELHAKDLRIEQILAQLARLKRLRFGRSSEKLDREIEQLELALEDLQEDTGERAVERPSILPEAAEKPARENGVRVELLGGCDYSRSLQFLIRSDRWPGSAAISCPISRFT